MQSTSQNDERVWTRKPDGAYKSPTVQDLSLKAEKDPGGRASHIMELGELMQFPEDKFAKLAVLFLLPTHKFNTFTGKPLGDENSREQQLYTHLAQKYIGLVETHTDTVVPKFKVEDGQRLQLSERVNIAKMVVSKVD